MQIDNIVGIPEVYIRATDERECCTKLKFYLLSTSNLFLVTFFPRDHIIFEIMLRDVINKRLRKSTSKVERHDIPTIQPLSEQQEV